MKEDVADRTVRQLQGEGFTKEKLERAVHRAEMFDIFRKTVPDSRCQRLPGQFVATPFGPTQLLYCLNCGKPGGGVYGDPEEVMYLCPPCTDRWGGLPLDVVPGTERL